MTKVQINSEQNYIFSIDYWFRYMSAGEQEKDFENVQITTPTFQLAKDEVLRRFSTPSRMIFDVILKNQTPTLTKQNLFDLTNPKNLTHGSK